MRARVAIAALCALAAALAAAPAALAGERTLTLYSPALIALPYQAQQGYMPLRADGVEAPAQPGWITAMHADVVDRRSPEARSLKIQDVMVHHLVFHSQGQGAGPLSCGNRFYARGEEDQHFDLPAGYGLANRTRAGRAPAWYLTHMLMNHQSKARTVYVRFTIRYSDEPKREVQPLFIDTRNCAADPIYDVPGGGTPGSTDRNVKSFTWPAGYDGRIVAAGGHLHGGGKRVALLDDSCHRTLVDSRAYYGLPSHPFYKVRPILHEASPVRIGIARSTEGIPVNAGNRIRLVGDYDDQWIHTRVMNILLGYFAPGPVAHCAAMPRDVTITNMPARYRAKVPKFTVPLVKPPRGPFRPLPASPLGVRDNFFPQGRIIIRRGTSVTWRFASVGLHSVTVANGPRGWSSPWLANDATFTYRPTVRGTYRLFCSLHPVAMTQELRVR